MINAPLPRHPYGAPDPAHGARLTRRCVRGVSCRPASPRLAPFPPPPPQRLPCSAGFVGYYEAIRHPTLVHPRRTATAFPGRPDPDQRDGQAWDLPVLADRDSLHAKVLTPPGPPTARADDAAGDVAFRSFGQRRHPETLISRLHSPACRYPDQRFAAVLGTPTHGRGHRGALLLRCRTLSFLSRCRFIPALPNGVPRYIRRRFQSIMPARRVSTASMAAESRGAPHRRSEWVWGSQLTRRRGALTTTGHSALSMALRVGARVSALATSS